MSTKGPRRVNISSDFVLPSAGSDLPPEDYIPKIHVAIDRFLTLLEPELKVSGRKFFGSGRETLLNFVSSTLTTLVTRVLPQQPSPPLPATVITRSIETQTASGPRGRRPPYPLCKLVVDTTSEGDVDKVASVISDQVKAGALVSKIFTNKDKHVVIGPLASVEKISEAVTLERISHRKIGPFKPQLSIVTPSEKYTSVEKTIADNGLEPDDLTEVGRLDYTDRHKNKKTRVVYRCADYKIYNRLIGGHIVQSGLCCYTKENIYVKSCFCCHNFNHKTSACKREKCLTCNTHHLPTSPCPTKDCCLFCTKRNLRSDHKPLSRSCQSYNRQLKNQRRFVDYGPDHFSQRRQVTPADGPPS